MGQIKDFINVYTYDVIVKRITGAKTNEELDSARDLADSYCIIHGKDAEVKRKAFDIFISTKRQELNS